MRALRAMSVRASCRIVSYRVALCQIWCSALHTLFLAIGEARVARSVRSAQYVQCTYLMLGAVGCGLWAVGCVQRLLYA
jgi:hypothetical protein